MALSTRMPSPDATKAENPASPKARELALEDELWLSRTIQLARMRRQPAGALCVANGRLIAEAVTIMTPEMEGYDTLMDISKEPPLVAARRRA